MNTRLSQAISKVRSWRVRGPVRTQPDTSPYNMQAAFRAEGDLLAGDEATVFEDRERAAGTAP